MLITSTYAALLTFLFIGLSVRALRLRRELRIAIGDAGNRDMLRVMRVHANFAEYAPLCLLLLGLIESQGAPSWLVHFVGVCLLSGRLAHAYGVSHATENFRFRVAGMALTFTALVVSATTLLGLVLRATVA